MRNLGYPCPRRSQIPCHSLRSCGSCYSYHRHACTTHAVHLSLNRSHLLCLPGRTSSDVQVLCTGDLDVGGGQEDFNVAWVALVRVAVEASASAPYSKAHKRSSDSHSSVGTVRPPPGLWGLVDDNVLDDQLVDVEFFGIGVGLGVLQETEDVLDRLFRPSTYERSELACPS